MVKCENLSVRYEDHFGIRHLNMQLNKGTTCAIVGRSGCGKTTLLHAIAGLVEPLSGSVSVAGEPVSDIQEDTAIILQDDGLFPWKTVYENVAIGQKIRGMADNALSILDELDILDQKDKYPSQLSGGQRKRVAIARSLALAPKLLLMDEPTGSLDMITKEAFQDQILALYREHKMTMMVVTHDIEEAVCLGERIIVMREGQITAEIDNPLFMEEDIRNQMAFYELCLKVRKELAL